jgi:hypothetical protein
LPGVDRPRFELWARRLLVDAAVGDVAGVARDLATLEWMRDRIAHTLTDGDRTRLDACLVEVRTAISDKDLPAAAELARQLAQR